MTRNDIDVGFLIKDAFVSIKNDLGYIGLFIIPMIANIVFSIGLLYIIGIDFMSLFTQNAQNPQALAASMSFIMDKISILILYIVVYVIVVAIIQIICYGAAIKKVEVQENNGKMSISEAFSFGISVFPRLFGAVIVAVGVIGWYLFLIIGLILISAISLNTSLLCLTAFLAFILFFVWIYMLFRFSLFLFACVIDGDGPIDCFKKSWQITKGNILLIFATGLIIFLIQIALSTPTYIFSYLAQTQLNFTWIYISTIYSGIISLIIAPFTVITFTLLYLKLKSPPPMMQQSYNPPNQFNPDQNIYNQQ